MKWGCGLQLCKVPAANGIDLGVWHHGGHHPLLAPWYQGVSGYICYIISGMSWTTPLHYAQPDLHDDFHAGLVALLQPSIPLTLCNFCEKSQLRPSIPGAVLVCLGCIWPLRTLRQSMFFLVVDVALEDYICMTHPVSPMEEIMRMLETGAP